MSDNTALNLGTGGDAVRTVDKAGVKTQVVTLDLGGSGVESLIAGSVPVSGTVAVSNFASLAGLPVTGNFYQATQPVSIAGTVNTSTGLSQPLTDTQLRATPVPVSGTVSTGLSQPLTDTQLRAVAVPVSGTFYQATQPVSIAGTVATNTGLSQPLTDTQLRATAVPVSIAGTVATSIASQPLPAGAATETTLAALNTKVTAVNTGAVVLATGAATIGAVTGPAAAPLALDATLTAHAQTFKSLTVLSTLSAANTAVTLTLPAAGVGLFHYLAGIDIVNINPTATAIAAAISTLSYTTTNIPGSLAWTCGNLLAAGTEKIVANKQFTQPVKTSVANTATTIVAPAIGAGGLVRITAYYYTAA